MANERQTPPAARRSAQNFVSRVMAHEEGDAALKGTSAVRGLPGGDPIPEFAPPVSPVRPAAPLAAVPAAREPAPAPVSPPTAPVAAPAASPSAEGQGGAKPSRKQGDVISLQAIVSKEARKALMDLQYSHPPFVPPSGRVGVQAQLSEAIDDYFEKHGLARYCGTPSRKPDQNGS